MTHHTLRQARRAAAALHRANRPLPNRAAVARIQANFEERMNQVHQDAENNADLANGVRNLAIDLPANPLHGPP